MSTQPALKNLIALWILVLGLFGSVAWGSSYYYLPHIVDGALGNETNVTRFTFYNPSAAENHLNLSFYDDAGGAPAIELVSAERPLIKGKFAQLTLTLQPKETVTLFTTGVGNLVTGWAQVSSDLPLHVNSGYIFLKNGIVQNDLGIMPAQAENGFHVEALIGDAEPVPGANTNYAVALVNPHKTSATAWLNLEDALGQEVSSTAITLPPQGHQAMFLTEVFSDFLPKFFDPKYAGAHSFHGHLNVRSDLPIALLALRYFNGIFSAVPTIGGWSAGSENLQEQESNGNFVVANPVAGFPALIQGTVSSVGSDEDFDYFKVAVPAGKTLYVNPVAQLAGTEARLTIELWSEQTSTLSVISRNLIESHSCMKVVDSNGDSQAIDPIAFNHTTGAAATYYIVVRGKGSSASRSDSYRLFVVLK